jgi:hypothetical protein
LPVEKKRPIATLMNINELEYRVPLSTGWRVLKLGKTTYWASRSTAIGRIFFDDENLACSHGYGFHCFFFSERLRVVSPHFI